MTQAEERAQERVDKAQRINDEVQRRLHQNDVQPGMTEKPAPKPIKTKAAANG